MPFEVKGGVAFYRRMEVLDAVAFLKLVARKDDLAFKRIVNKPPRRMGRVRVAKLQEMANPGEPLVDALARCINDPAFKGSGGGEFLGILEKLKKATSEQPLSEFIGTVLSETGYERYIREMGDMERFDNLVEFKQTAAEFVSRYGEEVTLDMYLDHLALQTDDELRDEGDKVKLMTIHASKGLEFPAVFVAGLSEGVFPSPRTVEERKALGLEEERRLCYVAITRAREELYLTDSEGRTAQGQSKLPSRFLFEIGEDHYARIGTISRSLRDSAARYVTAHNPQMPVKTQSIPDRVAHPVFGDGFVRKVNERQLTCEVWFEKMGQTRTLSLQFVKEHPRSLGKNIVANPPEGQGDAPVTAHAERDSAHEGREALIESTFRRSGTSPDTPTEEASSHDIEKRRKDDKADAEGGIRPGCTTLPQGGERAPLSPKYRYKDLTDDPNETNLWKRSDVPHEGWTCTDVTDLGKGNRTICSMCGEQEIRYVHHMVHPDYPNTIDAGRICAGWMEGDPDAALQRERDLKNRQKRRKALLGRKWKRSRKGNDYIKVDGHNVVVFEIAPGKWKYAVGNESSSEVYSSKDDAALEAFDTITRKPKSS